MSKFSPTIAGTAYTKEGLVQWPLTVINYTKGLWDKVIQLRQNCYHRYMHNPKG